MLSNLITQQDINTLARPCTSDADVADAFIAEAQRADVRSRIGDAIYLRLFETDPTAPEKTLLEGGKWTDNTGAIHYLVGLKTALAYYALARIIRDGNIQASRYGAVIKDDERSSEPYDTERNRQYRELFSQADAYMAECLAFIQSNNDAFPGCIKSEAPISNRARIRVIRKRR